MSETSTPNMPEIVKDTSKATIQKLVKSCKEWQEYEKTKEFMESHTPHQSGKLKAAIEDKLSKAKDTLPWIPSELVSAVVKDLNLVREEKKYVIDMGRWHSPRSAAIGVADDPRNPACFVCLGGCAMVGHFNVPDFIDASPSDFSGVIELKIRSYDMLRSGDVAEFLGCVGKAIEWQKLADNRSRAVNEQFVSPLDSVKIPKSLEIIGIEVMRDGLPNSDKAQDIAFSVKRKIPKKMESLGWEPEEHHYDDNGELAEYLPYYTDDTADEFITYLTAVGQLLEEMGL